MATLEDKILGEKLQYYCSSSEDEGNSDSEDSGKERENKNKQEWEGKGEEKEISEWDGTSSNTGPKGVIRVQRTFFDHEKNRREN